ncbi:MAG: ATP-binding cassette domain-containing protein [Bacteroidales bacterium]|nr:ATP-binding cassette domain-containing protein [Bacteroidales bacterium]
MPFFEALEIDKLYGQFKALDKVSIHVPQGSIYGLLGPNGAGKTTLIRIINKITAPDSGELRFRGEKFTREDVQYIGYLPEERGLYKKMKVGEQALYLAQLKGLGKREAMSKLKYWFNRFEMTDWWNKKVEQLSKGMAQKVQFIVTVLHDPKLLIFDEPFSGFDPVNANMLKKEVLELRDKGITIIFSTHDMASVEELCDHITLINKSKTILEGRVDDIREKFKSNSFELIFDGDQEDLKKTINNNAEVLITTGFGSKENVALIKLNSPIKGNDLLKQAMKSVNIHSFRELLPTMNEIFIKAVSQN